MCNNYHSLTCMSYPLAVSDYIDLSTTLTFFFGTSSACMQLSAIDHDITTSLQKGWV